MFFGWCVPCSVNASEYPLGTYVYEPYYVRDDYEGTWEIYDLPSLFISSGSSDMPDVVEENISVTEMSYIFRNASGVSMVQGNFDFGVAYNYSHVSTCTFILFNDGKPLFSNGGEMYLFVVFDGYNGNVKVTYSSGVTENLTLVDANTDDGTDSGSSTYNYVVIPNSDADLTKIEVSGSCNSDVGYGTYLGMSLVKYGYVLDEVPVEENHSKNIFELLKGFIENFSTTISNAFKNAVSVTIEGLFVPDEEFLKTKTEALQTQFWDSMGILAYPIAYLKELMYDLSDCSPEQAVFTFPRLEWEGQTLVEETTFDLYSFFYDNGFGFVLDACRFFTSVVLVGAFLSFCQDTLRRILDDN